MFRAMHSVVEVYFPFRPLNQIVFINCYVSFKIFGQANWLRKKAADLLVPSCHSEASDGSRKGRLCLRLAN